MKYSLFYEGNINSSYAFVITFSIQQLLLGRFKPCFFTCSSAFLMNFFLSLVNSSARSARSGCSGSGSCTRATSDCITETNIRNVDCYYFYRRGGGEESAPPRWLLPRSVRILLECILVCFGNFNVCVHSIIVLLSNHNVLRSTI